MIKKGNNNNIVVRVKAIQGEFLVIRFLVAVLGLCILAYIYFVGLSIMNVVANREAVAASERIQSNVSSLEKEYFNLSSSITPSLAVEQNLVETADIAYVRRTGGMATNRTLGDN